MLSNQRIGEKFRKIRESRNKTIEEFSMVVGSNKSTWSRIEKGQKKTLSYEEISIYCKNADIKIAEIYGTNYESYRTNQTKSIKALENNRINKKIFFRCFSILVIFSNIYSALYPTVYTITATIVIWIFFSIAYIYSNLIKDEAIVPTINYPITEYPMLINSIEEFSLKEKLKMYRFHNIYNLLVFTLVYIILIGRFNNMLQTDEQMFLIFLFIWSIAWELVIVFDFNASKFFTKTVFYEGSEKNFGFSKLNLSIINNSVLLFSYFMIETSYNDDQMYLKIATAFLMLIVCVSNWFRYEIKYSVVSKYSLEFDSNPSLK